MEYYYPKGSNKSYQIKNDTLFIITTEKEESLKVCIQNIRKYHDADILVLKPIDMEIDIPNIYVENMIFPDCVELNTYVWACKNIFSYKRFVYIQDSVILLSALEFDNDIFKSLWHSSKCVEDNTTGAEVDSILEKFTIDGSNIHEKLKLLQNGNGSVVFSCMGIFTSKFLDFLSTRTNFLEIVEYFCTKNLRCFFERLLYIIVRENNCNYDSLCGDIFNQQGAFQKTESIDSKTAGNKYAIRIWSA